MTTIAAPPSTSSILNYPPNFPAGIVNPAWLAWFQTVQTNSLVYPTPQTGFALGWDAGGNLINVANTGADQTAAWTAADAVVTSNFQAADAGLLSGYQAADASIRADIASPTANKGTYLVGYLAPYTGAVGTTAQKKLAEGMTPEDFGCIGDGVADDTIGLTAFFAASTGKVCKMPGVYKVTSLLSLALTNCHFIGSPNKTKITGAFDYATVKLLDQSNVIFEDIIFETTYTNAVEDTGKSVVYSLQNNATNVVFKRCTFTAPNANTSGLTFYTRISDTDSAHSVNGLWIEDCLFTQLGRLGCTLMNRGVVADRYTAFSRVFFNRNKAVNTGLNNLYGFILSLDGYGSAFTADHNEGWNAYGCVIENTGWINGSISHNKLKQAASTCRLLSLDGTDLITAGAFIVGEYYIITTVGTTDFTLVGAASNTVGLGFTATGVGAGTGTAMHPHYMTNLTVIGNTCDVVATAHSNINYVKDSIFINNYHWSNGTNQAVLFRGSFDNEFIADTYINGFATGTFAFFSDTTSSRNTWDGACIFDNSASGTNTATIRFADAGTGNVIKAGAQIKKGTGGSYFDQTGSATLNFAEAYSQAITLTLAGATTAGAPTYTVQSGNFTKVGKRVKFSGRISITAIGGMVGDLLIKGLPIADGAQFTWGTMVQTQANGITLGGSNTFHYGTINSGESQVRMIADGSAAGATPVQAAWLAASTTIIVSGEYESA